MGILDRQTPEIADIDGLPLPMHECLSIREMREYAQIIREISGEVKKGDTSANVESNLSMQEKTTTLMLQRLDPDWTLEKTQAEEWTLPIGKDGELVTFRPDHRLLEAVHEFFDGESRRWRTLEEIEAESEKKLAEKPRTGKKRTSKSA